MLSPAEQPAASRRGYRVLQVGKFYAPFAGGIESHLKSLCEYLRDRVDLRVVVANEGPREAVDSVDGVEVVRAGTRWTLAGAPVCPEMIRMIRASDADVVHLHLPNPAATLAYLASGHRGGLVVSYHSDVVRQRLLGAAFRPFLHRVLRRADAIIVASPNYLESSPDLMPFREKCRVIPYGLPRLDAASAEAEAEAVRRRYGDRIVLGVGRLVYYKGFEHVIDAMARVRGHLLIVGEGPLRPELEARARARGLGDRVTFLGKVANTVPYYRAADVFVLASIARSEAFGIVQLEAMACGTPVVNTELDSGVPFVSRDGETGLTVPPADPRALAAAINRLLDDRELRDTFGRAAVVRVAREFDPDHVSERVLALYDEMVSPGARGARPGVDSAPRPVYR